MFTDRLREERERLGLSQTAMAACADVTKMSQINYEKGARSPDAKYLDAIARAGVDVLYILTGRRERVVSRLDDRARLALAIEAIEEGLAGKVLPPAKKAEAILLAYELLAEPSASRDNVVELVRRVA